MQVQFDNVSLVPTGLTFFSNPITLIYINQVNYEHLYCCFKYWINWFLYSLWYDTLNILLPRDPGDLGGKPIKGHLRGRNEQNLEQNGTTTTSW